MTCTWIKEENKRAKGAEKPTFVKLCILDTVVYNFEKLASAAQLLVVSRQHYAYQKESKSANHNYNEGEYREIIVKSYIPANQTKS